MSLLETTEEQEAAFNRLQEGRKRVETELGKAIIGQKEVVEQLLLALISGGHCLITGAPGLAKTLLVKSVAKVFRLNFQRIQFTPDLMPADITGTEILNDTPEGRKLVFAKGPIFTNMLLADEINRTPPKTQSALLEAMQEHQVTAAGTRHTLSEPFFVLATQNPVEMEGTYPLPEAQLDRFLFNVLIDYLPEADEIAVVKQTTSKDHDPIESIFSAEDIIGFQSLVRKVPVSDEVIAFAVKLVAASRPKNPNAPDFVKAWVNWGAGTRAAQGLILAGKALALWQSRAHVTKDDIVKLAPPVLRHRILLNYRAEAEGETIETVTKKLIQHLQSQREFLYAQKTIMSNTTTMGIDPAALFAIRDLELRARVVVEGLWSGLHRSPLEGFSVEFTEYRNYSPGDDLRYLDWKVLARTDQEYIKKFEDETNLRCMILVDTSRSMQFTSGEASKAEYARTLAATLSYFLLQQRDVVGLGLIDRNLHQFLRARWRPGQFRRLLSLLSQDSEGKETNLGNGLDQIARLIRKRSLIMVISDFLSPPEEWEKSLGQLIAAGHDVRAIQILDSAELDLEFGKASQWEDLETGDQIYVDPNEARSAYKASFAEHQEKIRRSLEMRGIRHLIAPTNKPLDFVLIDLLKRQPLKGRVGL